MVVSRHWISMQEAPGSPNRGGRPLNVASISVSGDFAETNDCGASLSAGSELHNRHYLHANRVRHKDRTNLSHRCCFKQPANDARPAQELITPLRLQLDRIAPGETAPPFRSSFRPDHQLATIYKSRPTMDSQEPCR